MIRCTELNLNNEKNRIKAESFLETHGLRLEKLDRMYVLLGDREEWLGCGGRFRNVLKCFAIDETRRNEALLDLLVTELLKDSYMEGLEDLFIYTKSGYGELFTSFGFSPVADTGTVCLLHRGPSGIHAVLKGLHPKNEESGVTGAIVVNANPFTYGHRYLIETSAAKVDQLFVFVVENDASRFPFKDRFHLVKLGTADLPNVTVLRSTEFIISNATFPSYFLKETALADRQHALLDSLIFKKYFIPWFGITKRFLGEEPMDQSTSIYNETLLSVLPPECEVIIIPRKKHDEHYISASTVRRALDSGDFDLIREMVPKGTYDYLKENYG